MKVIIVGRDASCDIVVNDAKVSRQHLQIVMNDGGQMSVIDLNSTNGSYINGSRIKGECKVTPKDILKVGDTVITWDLVLQKLNGGAPIPQTQRPISSPSPKPQNGSNRKPKKTLVWIIILVAVILVGGGVTYYFMRESEKSEQKRLETQEKYINDYQGLSDDKEQAEKEAEKADMNAQQEKAARKKAEAEKQKAIDEATKAEEAEKDANEKAAKAKKAEQEAKDKAEEAKRDAKVAEEKAKRARAEADSLKAKAQAQAEADSLAKVQAQNELIDMMDETLDIKIKDLKDKKAVAELLGLPEPNKNPDKKIRDAFNEAKSQGNFDRMKQIYDSVKNGNVKPQDNTASQIDELNNRFGEMRKVYDKDKALALAIAQALGLEKATEGNAKSKITSAFNDAKKENDVARMTEILNVIEQMVQEAQQQQPEQDGNNAEPQQKEEEGNPDAKTGDMSGDSNIL